MDYILCSLNTIHIDKIYELFSYDWLILSSHTETGLRVEHRLRAFENRVLRRIFESKRDYVIGGWRKLHNEEPHNVYFSRRTQPHGVS
jgi:hypothetical protein